MFPHYFRDINYVFGRLNLTQFVRVLDSEMGTVRPSLIEFGTRLAYWVEASDDFFGHNTQRREYEAIWTRPAYAELERIVRALPVHWRYFVKQKVFEGIAKLPASERRGEPAQVRAVYQSVVEEYPQLKAARPLAAE